MVVNVQNKNLHVFPQSSCLSRSPKNQRSDTSPSKRLHVDLVLTSHHHHGHREDLLSVRGGRDVPEADGGQAGHGEVQGGDVQRVLPGPALPLARPTGVVAVGRSDADGELVEPAVRLDGVGGFVDDLVVSDAVPEENQRSFSGASP